MSDEVLREIENLVARVKHGAYVDDALEELARIAREEHERAEAEFRVASEMCERAEKAEAERADLVMRAEYAEAERDEARAALRGGKD